MVKKQKKLFKVKKLQKLPKKLKISSLKIHRGAGIWKKTKAFLNKGTKHKKNYMKGLSLKNKNKKSVILLFVVIFLARVLSITKRLLFIVRNKIKKRIMTIGWKQKSYSKSKKCQKNAQKLKIFNFKIHKGAGIFKKKPKPSYIKALSIKKIIWKA